MQEKQLFEYAVVRVVPKVEREEFINVGVILYCRQEKYLQCRYQADTVRLHAFASGLDIQEVEAYLRSFEKICRGIKDGGPIARLDAASRFRWLTATRSTVVQTSNVHPGLCADADMALEKLFLQLVL